MIIGSWNVWGLNNTHKQQEVRNWIQFQNLDIVGLLETRISHNKMEEVQASTFPLNWGTINNIEGNINCRILVGWNSSKFCVQCVHVIDQWVTCDVSSVGNPQVTRFTFVYGSNNYSDRVSLWHYLRAESVSNDCIPWSILGDFNAVLRSNDRSGGSTIWHSHHNDFSDCVMRASLL